MELWVSSRFQLVLRTTADARYQSPPKRQHRADQRRLTMNHPDSRVTRALVTINALSALYFPIVGKPENENCVFDDFRVGVIRPNRGKVTEIAAY